MTVQTGGTAFTLGYRVERACQVTPYEITANDPQRRPLRIFALDPSASRRHGNVARVEVPYEPLAPGPVGALFEVDGQNFDDGRLQKDAYVSLELDDPKMLLSAGLEPTQSDPRFHAQMTYAVCSTLYQRFREALGRTVAWGFTDTRDGAKQVRLRVKPFGTQEQNAYYDPDVGELLFGFYPADATQTVGRNLPRGFVYTCLGHDIVAHELTHALLDGLRAHFTTTTHPDVAAFHEGFADIIALLHRFSHQEVIREALRASRGQLDTERLLAIGMQFGETSGDFGPIRNAIDYAIDATGKKVYTPYDSVDEPHDRGRFLCGAIYEAFVTIYNRKSERYISLATRGSGFIDPRAELPADLLEILTDVARTLAGQFLNICIRAIDYCPPVDIRFGDYLRAVITADKALVPEDKYGYREAWIDAFQRRKIYPQDVSNLGEDALMWRAPQLSIPRTKALSFAELAFDGDPGRAPSAKELRRQASAVGKLVTRPQFMEEFGLVSAANGLPKGVLEIDRPVVDSVRAARRVGPNAEIVFDLVAEVTQRIVRKAGKRGVELFGGSTIIVDPLGGIRYVIRKKVLHEDRDKEQLKYILSDRGAKFWLHNENGLLTPNRSAFKLIHESRRNACKD